jgi:hypothetical protein
MSTYTLANNPLPDLQRRQKELSDKYEFALEMCHFYRRQIKTHPESGHIFTSTILANGLDVSLQHLEVWAGRAAVLKLEVAEVANEIEDRTHAYEQTVSNEPDCDNQPFTPLA